MENEHHDVRPDPETVPDNNGSFRSYENEFMQHMVLRWGKITSVVTLEDTQRFVDLLPALAGAGMIDATAAPITDEAAALNVPQSPLIPQASRS